MIGDHNAAYCILNPSVEVLRVSTAVNVNARAPFQYKDILSSYLTGMGNSHVKGKTAGKTSFR